MLYLRRDFENKLPNHIKIHCTALTTVSVGHHLRENWKQKVSSDNSPVVDLGRQNGKEKL